MGWPTVQLYQNGAPFFFSQNGNASFTSGFVVDYSIYSNSTALSAFQGMSFVRDFPREQRDGELFDWSGFRKDGTSFYLLGLSPDVALDAGKAPEPVEKVGDGPAVNLDGLY
jgi:hypothetical protein